MKIEIAVAIKIIKIEIAVAIKIMKIEFPGKWA